MTTALPASTPAPSPATPDPERYVTYRSLLPLLGGVLFVLATMGGGLTIWILGSARAEAQVPLARVAAVEEARKAEAATNQRELGQLTTQITTLRTEIRQDGVATRGKIDDLMILLASGKVRTAGPTKASAPSQVPTSIRDPP